MKSFLATACLLAVGLAVLLAACTDDDDSSTSSGQAPGDDDTTPADDDDASPNGDDDDDDNDDDDDDLSPPPGWRMELIDDQGPFGDNRLRVSPSGQVHLAYGVYPSAADSMLKHAVSGGAAWQVSTVWTFSQGGGYFDLALRDETPTIAYQRYVDIVAGQNQLVLTDRSGASWAEELVWDDVFDAYDLSLYAVEESLIVFCDQAIVEDAAEAKVFLAVRAADEWTITEEFPGFSPALRPTTDGKLQIAAFVDSAAEEAPAEQRGKLVLWTESAKGWTWESVDDLADYGLSGDSPAYFSHPVLGMNENEEPSVAYYLVTTSVDYPEEATDYSVVLAQKAAGIWETETFCTDCYLRGYQQEATAVRRLLFTDENNLLVLADDQSGAWTQEALSLPDGYLGFAVDGVGSVHLGYAPALQGQAQFLYYLTNQPE